jgi:hypothetical protein
VSEPSRVGAMLGQTVDLLSIDTSEPRPWTCGARRIMRPGLRSIWFGARGSGKSLAALLLGVQVIEAGGSVIYCDLENGPRRQADRLQAILADRPAATRAAIIDRLDYRPRIRLGPLTSPAAVSEWAALFTGRDLAIIDSTARALGQLGLSEDSTPEYGRFMVQHIDPPAEQGTAFLLLDNTGWAETDRSRGASGKWDMCELVYKITGSDFTPEKAGTITLDQVRSRDGEEAPQLVAHVGEGTYSELHEPEVGEREAALHESLVEYVGEHPGESTEAIAKGLHLRLARVRDGLAILEGTGTAIRQPSRAPDGNGRARTRKGWYLTQPSQLAAVPQLGTDTDGYNDAAIPVPPSPSLKTGRGTADDLARRIAAINAMPESEQEAAFGELEAEHLEATA